MLIEQIMKKDVITLPPSATIANAISLLEEHRIRHIPIVDDNKKIIGIISDRDLRDASPSIFESAIEKPQLNHKVQSIMSHPVITIHPLDFVEEVAKIFYDQEFAALPVTRNERIIGIVTERDMLDTLIQLTGTHVQSSHIEVKVPHQPGILPEVTALFGKRKVNIISVLIYPYLDNPNYKVLVFRVQTINPEPLITDLKRAGYQLLWPRSIQEPNS